MMAGGSGRQGETSRAKSSRGLRTGELGCKKGRGRFTGPSGSQERIFAVGQNGSMSGGG